MRLDLSRLVRRLARGYALLAAPWAAAYILAYFDKTVALSLLGATVLFLIPYLSLIDGLGLDLLSPIVSVEALLFLALEATPIAYLIGGRRRGILIAVAATIGLLALGYVALIFLLILSALGLGF